MSVHPAQLILKKRNGGALSESELAGLVEAFTRGDVPDYQMAAFLMATYFRGMTSHETFALTKAVAESGDLMDLSAVPGPKADKHSTGGVGDNVSLVLAPLAAAVGLRVPMVSGRGLEHTGGTLDKLESLSELRTSFAPAEFMRIVSTVGAAIVGQSDGLAPADGKLYALRDVTGTVDSLPLIISSILSKKLAAGIRAIVLDVKTGSGAFMERLDDARELARAMVDVGRELGMNISAFITDMSQPLGRAVGNSLEVLEAARTLQGAGPPDLTELALTFAEEMARLAGMGNMRQALEGALKDGTAYSKFVAMITAQGADADALERLAAEQERVPRRTLTAEKAGWVVGIGTRAIGWAVCALGGGRKRMDDTLDYTVGCVLHAKLGDRVAQNDPLVTAHGVGPDAPGDALDPFARAVTIGDREPEPSRLVYEAVW